MEANSGVDLCRVTVVAPRTRMDLALPTDAPLADLLPTLLRFAGENPDDPAFLRGGWILQRLGDPALDASQRLGRLGVRDGDVLYLRHKESDIPEFAFDDVADAITTATRTKRAAWMPGDSRTTGLLVSGVFFVLGALLALTSGPSWILPSIVTLIAAIALVGGGLAVSRALGNGQIGAFLGAFGVLYGALGGFLLLGGDKPLLAFGAAQLAVGLALALLFAAVAAIAIVSGWNGFFGVAAAALVGIVASVIVLLIGFDTAAVGAVTVAMVLALTPLLPTLCARFARLPLPMLPSNAEDLRKQTDVLPGPTVLQQALNADRMMTGVLGATAAVVTVGCIFLATGDGWPTAALTGIAGLALLLRSRHFRGRSQRIWLLGGGVACGALLLIEFAMTGGSATTLLAAGLPCLIAAGAVAAWSISGPEGRPSPYWARITDIFEVLVLLTIVPITLGVAGVYESILEWFFI